MAIFKCKMCGGDLIVNEGQTVCECDYCGTKQTVPKLNDDRKINLYDRANHFRRNNEFDKASGIYEQILNEDPTDSEAYWSLVLCRYGIEYVEDPLTHNRIPTVNRAQFTSIFDDDNFKQALAHADMLQKSVYEEEAHAINEIQKGILAISQNEEPFDVFICYKETDNNGRRTQDSVLANDLYHQLTQEGFKVFFSRITLEDKLGTAYEPYIFAALNSARVMIVLGTKPEYFNAVWVKNEWSRYLALVKDSQGKKVLIPAYRDMDPYDLPEEFSHLQAQDMGKLGFMQDIIRGIKKILESDNKKQEINIKVNQVNDSIAPLLRRGFIFLEEGDFDQADGYFERVLDQDPESGEAYLGKLMAELKVQNEVQLKDQDNPFDTSRNYERACSFGSDELKTKLKGYINFINTRNDNAQKTSIYQGAMELKEKAHRTFTTVSSVHSAEGESVKLYKKAAEEFDKISGWKDAEAQAFECREQADFCSKEEKYIVAKGLISKSIIKTRDINEAVSRLEKISGYKDSDNLKDSALKLVEDAQKYEKALELSSHNNIKGYKEAVKLLKEINDFNDSSELIERYQEKIKQVGKKQKRIGIIAICASVLVSILLLLTLVIIPQNKYNAAVSKYGKEFTDQFYSLKVGDIYVFGGREWRVLSKNGTKVLLLADKGVKSMIFDKSQYTQVTQEVLWENSDLRLYLNVDFYKTTFSDKEKQMLMIVNGDKVSLLNEAQVNHYLKEESDRICWFEGEKCEWWINNQYYPGISSDYRWVKIVDKSGEIEGAIMSPYNYKVVRPVIQVDISQ